MIVIKLIGGLGNQMFQYAAGRAASLENNTNLKLDLSNFKKDLTTKRKFSLNIFNIQASIATEEESLKLKIDKYNFFRYYFPRVSRLLNLNRKKTHFKEHQWQGDWKITGKDAYLDGEWQSEKYFQNYKEIIRKDFGFKQKIPKSYKKIAEEIKRCQSLSIHVRLGDYVHPKNINSFYQCPPEYFNMAIQRVLKQTKIDKIFLFCEDHNWGEKNLKTKIPYISVVKKDSFIDWQTWFQLMSMCKHHIIANSSYSWWAAWLNLNPEKIVVAPKRWYKDATMNNQDLIPNDWLRI